MTFTNSIISSLQSSETLAIKAKILELKAAGKEVVDLCSGEPDFDTPEHIKEAAIKALKEGKTRYVAVPGIPELRERLAIKFQEENKIVASADSVIISNGGKQAIHEFLEVVLESGDEVLIPSPYWVSYPAQVLLAGGKPVVVKTTTENSYKMTVAELRAAISEKTKVLILNSPSNPTGAAYSAEDFRALGTVLKDYPNILVMSDEVYEKITYQGFKFISFAAACPELADRTVTVNAFSKTYAMTGWRVGYATGPLEIIKAMSKFQGQTTSNINTPAQYAALSALNGSQDFIPKMNQTFWNRLQKAISLIENIPGLSVVSVPEGAFYLFVRIDPSFKRASTEFCDDILERAGVALIPGAAFGDDAAFRMSISVRDEEIEKGLAKIADLRAL